MSLHKQKGGYDVEFAGIGPNDVTCSICLFVLREPVQAEQCGHRFCKSCIEDMIDSQNGRVMCPEDRSIINVFKDKGKEREILNILVKCSNNKYGCGFTKELRELENHLDVCEFQTISCPIEGCEDQMQRKSLDSHTKDKHREDRLSILERKLEKACGQIENQRQLIDDQSKEIGELRQTIDDMREKKCNQIFYDTYIWKITNFGKKFQRAQCDMYCDPQVRNFFTTKGYKLIAKVYLNGDSQDWGEWLVVHIGLEQGPFDNTLKWPMAAKIKVSVLLNGVEHDTEVINTRRSDANFQKPIEGLLATSCDFHDFVLSQTNDLFRYVVNNTLTLKFSISHF